MTVKVTVTMATGPSPPCTRPIAFWLSCTSSAGTHWAAPTQPPAWGSPEAAQHPQRHHREHGAPRPVSQTWLNTLRLCGLGQIACPFWASCFISTVMSSTR